MPAATERAGMPGEDDPRVTAGEPIYDGRGRLLGTVRGFDEGGFYVTTEEGIESLSIEHARAGHDWGEAELVWRCSACGELGDLSSIPEVCPGCGAPREDLYYWTED